MTKISSEFQRLVSRKLLFRFYLLKNLPMAFLAGVRVQDLSSGFAVTTVRFKWLTQNPFRSMYFACQAMAAEMATGLILLDRLYGKQPAVSMLIVKNQAVYHKKATGKVFFTCDARDRIESAIEETIRTGEGVSVDLLVSGKDEMGEAISDFVFTWSLKMKRK